jgi:hypothetical protein
MANSFSILIHYLKSDPGVSVRADPQGDQPSPRGNGLLPLDPLDSPEASTGPRVGGRTGDRGTRSGIEPMGPTGRPPSSTSPRDLEEGARASRGEDGSHEGLGRPPGAFGGSHQCCIATDSRTIGAGSNPAGSSPRGNCAGASAQQCRACDRVGLSEPAPVLNSR